MAKWSAVLLLVLASVLTRQVVTGLPVVRAGGERSLDLVVENEFGHRAQMHFLVRAGDDSEALAAVTLALPALMPRGAVVESRAVVSAQFTPWGWNWAGAELPVHVSYNPAGSPREAEAAVRSALDAWSRVEGSRFRYAYDGASAARPGTQDGAYDGVNVIGWLELDCAGGCVLGVTSKVDDIHEVDIVLNSNPSAQPGDGRGGTVDIETTVLHEAGHMAGLEHSCQPFFGPCSDSEATAVMFFRYLGVHRTLGPDDAAGLRALYPRDTALASFSDGGLPLSGWPVNVQAGWTLAVLPVGAIEVAMHSLHCVSGVYAKQPGGTWTSWLRGATASVNTLTVAEPGRAYWLYSPGACSASFVDGQP